MRSAGILHLQALGAVGTEHLEAVARRDQRALRTVKGRPGPSALGGMALRETLQLEAQQQVAVVVVHRLGVRNFFGVVQPVDAAGRGDALRQARLRRPHARERHQRNVEHVHALVAQFAVAIVPEEAPVVMEAVHVEGPFRRGSEPHLVIGRGRRRGVRGRTDGFATLRDPGLHVADLAQLARGRVVGGGDEVVHAAALRAHLQHALVLARCVADELAFLNGLRERLLGVAVLARLAGQQRHVRVPVVGRRDQHRVDALVVQDAPEVVLLLGTRALRLFEFRRDLVEHRLIDVAERADARALLDEPQRHRAAFVAASDQSDVHAFVRAHGARVQIEKRRGRGRSRQSLEKSAAMRCRRHVQPLAIVLEMRVP